MKIILGIFIGCFGLIGALIGFLAIYDPVGIKLSDETDPYGQPISIIESIAITAVFILISVFGFWVAFKKEKRNELSAP